ncbi:uncharacterized protein LOC118230221 [Anguilla anguilla]|uniref:uncharacterized protein LOC118230221 n=1 Tax=Anguilla anguilla TaxID=7936 RepID=UPI0015B12BDC|nr:uncharacterized protein LOC118230221 [Anguilla anguilla]
MTSKKRFSVNEVLPQLFDSEGDIEENVSETEDNVEEDPDYEASSSDENETQQTQKQGRSDDSVTNLQQCGMYGTRKLQKPDISVDRSVQNSRVVNIVCKTKRRNPISSTNISCNLYIGDSSEPFRSTWTTSKPVCNFEVDMSDLQKSDKVSCDYSVNTDPRSPSPRSDRSLVVGKLSKAELKLSPTVIRIEESVNLRCSRPDSSPASHCTFTTNQRGPISGSDCERSVTGAELLSGSHSARNEITVRCFYSLERGPALHSDPLKVTVLDLRKPNISVSTEHIETRIRCEAPPDITGAIFFLYYNRSITHSKSTHAGTEERAVSFTVPRSSDSTLTYCCRYQFEAINSKLSDCAEAKNKDQSGRTKDQNNPQTARFLWRLILSALVLLAAIGILIEYFISHTPTTDFILHADAEDLKKPEISVQNSGSGGEVEFACQTKLEHLPSGTNVTCNLYIGDSSQPFRSTWTKNKDKVCIFIVKRDALKHGLQSVGATEVSCDYSVPTYPRSPSPRSDKRKIEGLSPEPSTFSKADLQKPEIGVQNSGGQVDLACQIRLKHLPSSTNVTCNLYIGDSSEPFRSTWTKNQVCSFVVKQDDLKQGLQFVGATEVSCDYSVPTDPRSPSPRSDKRKIEGLSPEPSTFSKADLKKPEISVQNSGGEVDLVCQIRLKHLPSGTNVTCNLYIGDSSEPFRSTWTKNQFCFFVVKRDDLKQGLQSVGATEVNCDYSVPTDPRSPSPRSDKRKIEDLKKPEISVQNSGGEVDLVCQTKLEHLPSGTNVSCNLYIGDSFQPFRSTWTKHKDKVCIFIVKRDDLKQGLQPVGATEVSCDYSVPTDPRSPSPRSDKIKIEGLSPGTSTFSEADKKTTSPPAVTTKKSKLPKAELHLSPAVISIKESVNLRCRRPDSAPASHCTFTTNQRGPISGSDCERSVTGAELLSRSHSARNEITMTCFYRLEEGEKPALHSDPSTVTVLDLRKPNISVSTEHTETHIRCEAPPDITGAIFFLYSNRSRTHTKSTQAGTEERAVSFTVPRSSDSTLTYCCRYKFKAINSKRSDCAEAKNKDQSGRTKDQSKLPKPKLELSPAVISIEESVNLRCSRPDSSPASHCTFTTNQRGPISGSDCERSVTRAELLSGSHSARNEITMRCFYRLEGGPVLQSDPSKMTVLDLRKPNISVSTEHTETHIRCEAPPDITGAIFYLYYRRSYTHTKSTQTGTEERAVSFTDPRSSDSTLTYCCSYQVETIISELSDCAEAKNKDQSGRTKDQRYTTTDNPQTAVTGSSSEKEKPPTSPPVMTKKTSTAHSTTTFNTTASLQSTSAARSAVTAASRTSHHSSGKVTSQPPQTPAQQTAEPPTEPRTVPTTELRMVSTTELHTVSTTAPNVILPVGIGSVVGVAVLGMTAVCLCKRYKRQKSKRRTEHINSSLYASVTMENILSASNTGGIDGIYTEINNVPSTFKSPPVPSQNDTYSLITAVPASSKLPLPDASVEMENILSASNTGGTDGIYTEINNVPSTFKSPPVPSQNDTYSLIPAVPASSKLPLPGEFAKDKDLFYVTV